VVISLDVEDIEVEFDPENKSTVDLFGEVGVKMKYPGFNILNNGKDFDIESPDTALKLIIDCIEFIYDGDKIYDVKDQSQEELKQFLENLTHGQLEKIKTFFKTMPSLKKTVEFDCPVCKYHHNYTIEGINNFF